MFYLSAIVAVTGVVGYQYFAKHVPETLNPIVSVIVMYLVVLVLGVILLRIFPAESGLRYHLRQVNWIQIAMAVCVTMGQLGFLLMYRYGWNLSTGNIVTGVFVNIILVGVGVALLGEKLSLFNAIGIILSILGVVFISLRS
jgi:drug/metabolite transporter (DMT)-like permease